MEPWVLIWQQSLTEQQRWFKLSRLDGLIKNGSRINWRVCLCKTLSALRLIRHWVNWDLCVVVLGVVVLLVGVWALLQDNPETLSLSSSLHCSWSAGSEVRLDYLCCCRFNQTAANGLTGHKDWSCCDHKTRGKVHHYHRSFIHYQLIIDHSWLIILQYKQSRIYQELLTQLHWSAWCLWLQTKIEFTQLKPCDYVNGGTAQCCMTQPVIICSII